MRTTDGNVPADFRARYEHGDASIVSLAVLYGVSEPVIRIWAYLCGADEDVRALFRARHLGNALQLSVAAKPEETVPGTEAWERLPANAQALERWHQIAEVRLAQDRLFLLTWGERQ